MPPRLFLNHIPEAGWLVGVEFGRVDDGQPDDRWLPVNEDIAYLRDQPDGRIVGFKVCNFGHWASSTDAEEIDELAGPEAPLFCVPVLGLEAATAAKIIREADRFFDGEQSLNRFFFGRGVAENDAGRPEQALYWWRACLQSGDAMAHFAIAYTLYELGRFQEARPHVRHYVRIAPHHPWNWTWLGKIEQALGNDSVAALAYERAIVLTDSGEDETEAPELLAALEGGGR